MIREGVKPRKIDISSTHCQTPAKDSHTAVALETKTTSKTNAFAQKHVKILYMITYIQIQLQRLFQNTNLFKAASVNHKPERKQTNSETQVRTTSLVK